MTKLILEPLLFASGVSLFLYTHNQSYPLISYITPLPFWVALGRPLGLFWNNKVLKQINRDIFPPDMRNYRQLYLISRRALAYDIIFNHIIFQGGLTALVVLFAYATRKIWEINEIQLKPARSLWDIVANCAVGLVQIRILISLTSILSQYWISYFSVKTLQGAMAVNSGNKRILLLKQLILNICWHSYILKSVNDSYLKQIISQ